MNSYISHLLHVRIMLAISYYIAFNEFCHFTLQNEIAIFQIFQQLQFHQT